MIISRTPFRISFFGGGTDYPVWYRENPGAVIATTINKYCYISVRPLPPFFEYRSRILYSKVEHVNDVSEIQHPAVRATLQHLDVREGIELHHDADLPARTGLGSSSTFTVGLLNALYGLKGRMVSKMQLSQEAFHIEHRLLRETVGAQDQTLAAFGGFNRIDFSGDCEIKVTPMTLAKERLDQLLAYCMLLFTGFTRTASEIAAEQVNKAPQRGKELRAIYQMVGAAEEVLKEGKDLADFGHLLHESWLLKKSLSAKISTPVIDGIYEEGRKAGAIGGKILGAGGGGFMLLFARPEDQPRIREKLSAYLHVPFRFENGGSQIIFYDTDPLRS